MFLRKMKYHFCYKYYKLETQNFDVIFQVSYDNTLGSGVYGVNTNIMFQNAEGDNEQFAGIGKTENDAIEMCLKEFNEFCKNNKSLFNLSKDITESDLKEIDLPYCVTFVQRNHKYSTVYCKKEANELIVLTDKTKFVTPINQNVISTLEKNLTRIKNSNNKNFTKEYLEQNNFYPIFTLQRL